MFPYDVFTFIENIENKPCLWDKSVDDYKNTIVTRNAWIEICKFFEPSFDTFEDKKKTETIKLFIKKWNNIRDTFKKSLVTKSGQAPKKKYVYHAQLQFLLKVFQPQDTADNYNSDSTQDSSTQISTNESNCPTPSTSTQIFSNESVCPTPSTSTANSLPTRNKKRMNPVDVEILRAIQTCGTNSINQPESIQNDDDMAFLQSMLPSIKQIRADDKLEFRIEMMQLLRKYTNKERLRHLSSTDSLGSTASQTASPARTSAAVMTPAQHNVTHDIEFTIIPSPGETETQNLETHDIEIHDIRITDEIIHTNTEVIAPSPGETETQKQETANYFSQLFNQNFSDDV